MATQKAYTEEQLRNKKIGTLRTIARDLKVKNYTSFPKEKLIDQIVDAQQTLINAGLLEAPKPEKPKAEDYTEREYNGKTYLVNDETGEVIEKEQDEKNASKPKDETKPKDKPKPAETIEPEPKVEQVGLDLDGESESKPEEHAEEHELTEEELQEQRRASVEKYREERGYVPPEEKKKREPIGGEQLTRVLIVAVPIAALLAIYCGLEAIIFVISKLWYGDLAYVPINLVPKIIICVISIGIIEFAKYSQKFDVVIDHYASKLKKKDSEEGD